MKKIREKTEERKKEEEAEEPSRCDFYVSPVNLSLCHLGRFTASIKSEDKSNTEL